MQKMAVVAIPNRRHWQRLILSAWLGAACAAAGPELAASAQVVPGVAVLAAVRGPAPAPRQVISATTAERVVKLWEVAAGGSGRATAVSRRVGLVAYSNGESVRLYDLAKGVAAGEFTPDSQVLRGGLVFVDKTLIVACARSIAVWDPVSKKRLRGLEVADSEMSAVAFQGDWIAVGHRDGVIRIYSLRGQAPREIVVPGPPIDVKSLALTPDGNRVVVAWVQGSIWWWSLDSPSDSHPLVRYEHESDAVAFSADGSLLVEEGEEQQTSVWRFDDAPSRLTRLRHGAWLKRMVFTPDGNWLLRAGSDGLELAEIAGPRRVELDTREPVEDAAFDEKATAIASADRSGRLSVFAVKR